MGEKGMTQRKDSALDISYDNNRIFKGVDFKKLEHGDKDEFNKVIHTLNEIDYGDLNDHDKKEIGSMLHELSRFDFEDIDFKIDNKKLGDLIEKVGASNIDPSMLGTLTNYADLTGREHLVVDSMLSMSFDKLKNVLENMDTDALSYTLEEALNKDDSFIMRRVDGEGKADKEAELKLATLFINSDMDIISDENIGDMIAYMNVRHIEVDQDTLVEIFNKDDVDIEKCFGGFLEDTLNKVDLSKVDFRQDLAKDILKNVDIEKVDAKKLVYILNKVDVSKVQLNDFGLNKVKAAIEKVESLGDDKNNKLLKNMESIKSQLEKKELGTRFDRHTGIDLNKELLIKSKTNVEKSSKEVVKENLSELDRMAKESGGKDLTTKKRGSVAGMIKKFEDPGMNR